MAVEQAARAGEPILQVRDLRVSFATEGGELVAVDGLSLDVGAAEILGIVGESGSGKSVASKAVLGLDLGPRASVTGEIRFKGEDLTAVTKERLRRLRGAEIAMIFQDPMSSMHPFFTVGRQISEAYRVHNDVSSRAARAHAIALLERVGIPDARRRVDAYPHEFSGGMRQRAMIAMALSCNPGLLIADEPTTALDVTVQAQILDLLTDLRREFSSAIVLITHDLGVVAETCDQVLVMYAGRSVEQGSVLDIFEAPAMPYTWGLLGSLPRVDETCARLVPIPGQPPSLVGPRPGCAFEPRCAYAAAVPDGRCGREVPPLAGTGAHLARCHLDAGERARRRPEDLEASR